MRQLFDVASDGLVLRLQVHPGAGKEAVVGVHGDALKVRVVAQPESGRANEAVLSLLARLLGVDRSALTITAGQGSRRKRVKIDGMESADLEKRLRVMVADSGPDHGPPTR
jgi:uncharacterized protein